MQYRASNGISYRIEGQGEPLVLLHGLMVTGAMFAPLVALLRDRFRMLIPDLRGHGKSGGLAGPYDVAALSADLDLVLADASYDRTIVMGYSHGGAVAQDLAHRRPEIVSRLILACTYACNVATARERIEAGVLLALLHLVSPATLGKLIVVASERKRAGTIPLGREQAHWLTSLMAGNRAPAMRGAVRGLIAFDSRPWLQQLGVPTLVVAGAQDRAVPRAHFNTLVNGIPGAVGRLIDGAGHTLIWTHTRDLAACVAA